MGDNLTFPTLFPTPLLVKSALSLGPIGPTYANKARHFVCQADTAVTCTMATRSPVTRRCYGCVSEFWLRFHRPGCCRRSEWCSRNARALTIDISMQRGSFCVYIPALQNIGDQNTTMYDGNKMPIAVIGTFIQFISRTSNTIGSATSVRFGRSIVL